MSFIKPMYDLFISYAAADRAWVEGYLLDALTAAGVSVIHDDAFELGAPRLREFEHAVQGSKRVLLVLSPAYLADDVSNFVTVLAQQYGMDTNTWPVIPLIRKSLTLPSSLAMLVPLPAATAQEAEDAVARLLADLARTPVDRPTPPCPYPGMRAFTEADSQTFFGRDAEIQALVNRLRREVMVTIIGPSGSGKSSLVFAGLIPALRASSYFPGDWIVCSLRPGDQPLHALAAALALPGAAAGNPSDELPLNWQAIVTVRVKAQTQPAQLLLVIDQLEEIFTQGEAEAKAFFTAVATIAGADRVRVVATVRADFYPDLMTSELWPAIRDHRLEIVPMDDDALRLAVVRPAEEAGVFMEGALVE